MLVQELPNDAEPISNVQLFAVIGAGFKKFAIAMSCRCKAVCVTPCDQIVHAESSLHPGSCLVSNR
jgi:hypothetical protein